MIFDLTRSIPLHRSHTPSPNSWTQFQLRWPRVRLERWKRLHLPGHTRTRFDWLQSGTEDTPGQETEVCHRYTQHKMVQRRDDTEVGVGPGTVSVTLFKTRGVHLRVWFVENDQWGSRWICTSKLLVEDLEKTVSTHRTKSYSLITCGVRCSFDPFVNQYVSENSFPTPWISKRERPRRSWLRVVVVVSHHNPTVTREVSGKVFSSWNSVNVEGYRQIKELSMDNSETRDGPRPHPSLTPVPSPPLSCFHLHSQF